MILAIIIAILSLLIAPSLVLATDTPIQISPVDNSTITQSKPKLTWQYAGNCPIDTKISCFRVELDTSLLFSNPKYNYTNSFSYSPQTLTDGKWYWRVKAKDISEIWSSWSTVWSFTLTTSTPAPTPTQIVTPSQTPSSTSFAPPSSSLFTISNIPSQINSDQSFSVSVNLSLPNNPNANFYLKGTFKKSDSSNYFGLTKVSGNWIKNSSNFSNQYSITTDHSGNWSGTLEVKPDSEDSGFSGTGDYIFKVGRYTATGSGPTWSNEETVKIISTENNQGEALTNNPSLTTNPFSPSPSTKTKIANPSQSKSYNRLVYHSASVAGTEASATPSATAVKKQKQTNPIIWIGVIFIFAGAGLIGYIYLKSNAKIPF